MNCESVLQIADAVMYEGYMLYPYRPSSVKNRQRWTFGGLYPEAYVERNGDASSMQVQLLVEGSEEPELSVTVRFLHLLQREDGLQEGMPREVGVGPFEFPAGAHQHRIEGIVERSIERLSPALHRVTIRVRNLTSYRTRWRRSPPLTRSRTSQMASLSPSSIQPNPIAKNAASQCINVGVWPVLAGDPGSREWMLVSPIILYDYPQIAPESAGDLFDGTEIDEILSLRIMTLTDQEKDEIRATDSRTRRVLERTESLSPEQMMKLHGVLRNPHALEGNAHGMGVESTQRNRRQSTRYVCSASI